MQPARKWKGNDHLTADDVRDDMIRTDVDFLLEEAPSAIQQSLDGMERISTIVWSMADFAGLVAGQWQEIADIALDLAPDKPGCLVSQTDFGQAIIELLSNAARAIAATTLEDGQRGRSAIATRQVDKQVEISVEDNGCGMTDDVCARAFEPFFTTRPLGTGLGHGLPTVQSFVIRHRGTINVESRPGTGTCVLIRLPLLLPN